MTKCEEGEDANQDLGQPVTHSDADQEQSEQSESDESDGDDEVTRPSRPSTSESTPRKTWRCQSSHGFSVPDA